MNTTHQDYIREAIAMATENVQNLQGGPFGAVIVKDGEVIGRGVNRVTYSNDPTAHAEVEAIRNACKNSNSFCLEGAIIYTSCEPCPMCLGAIYWARIERIYYAAGNADAAKAGFDDSFIYREISLPLEKRSIPAEQMEALRGIEPFKQWMAMEEKTPY